MRRRTGHGLLMRVYCDMSTRTHRIMQIDQLDQLWWFCSNFFSQNNSKFGPQFSIQIRWQTVFVLRTESECKTCGPLKVWDIRRWQYFQLAIDRITNERLIQYTKVNVRERSIVHVLWTRFSYAATQRQHTSTQRAHTHKRAYLVAWVARSTIASNVYTGRISVLVQRIPNGMCACIRFCSASLFGRVYSLAGFTFLGCLSYKTFNSRVV